MAFSGRLGTADSKLGNIELGSAGGGGATTVTQTIQARARILVVNTKTIQARARIRVTGNTNTIQARARIATAGVPQTIQARARIVGTQTQTITARARIRQVGLTATIQARAFITHQSLVTIQARARLRGGPTIQARASIINEVSSSLLVQYNVLQTLAERLTVRFHATLSDPNFHTITARARVLSPITSQLAVSYDVDYSMPGCGVTRPRQRAICRVIRTISARAHIHHG